MLGSLGRIFSAATTPGALVSFPPVKILRSTACLLRRHQSRLNCADQWTGASKEIVPFTMKLVRCAINGRAPCSIVHELPTSKKLIVGDCASRVAACSLQVPDEAEQRDGGNRVEERDGGSGHYFGGGCGDEYLHEKRQGERVTNPNPTPNIPLTLDSLCVCV